MTKKRANRIAREVKASEQLCELRASMIKVIGLLPLVIIMLFGSLLMFQPTRSFINVMRQENFPVELTSFWFLLAGGIWGLVLANETKKQRERFLVTFFYAGFSLFLLLGAMEEIAWGQWIFGFDTPAAIRAINAQQEFTLHNIRGLHGHTEYLRVLFGFGGLLGIWAFSRPSFNKIGAPPILILWFAMIAVFGTLDLFLDYFKIQRDFDFLIKKLDEVVEMLMGISGFLFVWLNYRRLSISWKKTA